MFAILFYLWIILMICEVKVEGISYVAWTAFLFFVAYGAGIRINLREKYQIDGNMVEDFFAGKLSLPCFISNACVLSFFLNMAQIDL